MKNKTLSVLTLLLVLILSTGIANAYPDVNYIIGNKKISPPYVCAQVEGLDCKPTIPYLPPDVTIPVEPITPPSTPPSDVCIALYGWECDEVYILPIERPIEQPDVSILPIETPDAWIMQNEE